MNPRYQINESKREINALRSKSENRQQREQLLEEREHEITKQKNELNEKKNLIEKNSKIEPIKTYKIPPLIGLNNLGLTSYKNSILQCLSQTESLTNFFLKEKNKNSIFNNNIALKNKNEPQLCPHYYNLIQNLWAKNGPKSFSPYNFMNIIENMTKNNPLSFRANEAGDAKDFIIFILEELHKELKKAMKSSNNQQQIPFNQYDRQSTLNHFIEEFKEGCSIISDEFLDLMKLILYACFVKKIIIQKD